MGERRLIRWVPEQPERLHNKYQADRRDNLDCLVGRLE